MTRALSLAAILMAGLAPPVVADQAAPKAEPGTTAANSAGSGNPFTMENAREHLMRQGYTNISPLERDVNGKWTGTASKNGKKIFVAVDVKRSTTR